MSVNVSPKDAAKAELDLLIKRNRAFRASEYRKLIVNNPKHFTIFDDLKNKYRNRKCLCGSRLKLKKCHGIKYVA